MHSIQGDLRKNGEFINNQGGALLHHNSPIPWSTFAQYLTAIESLNSVIRAAIRKCKAFPTDDSVRKVIYLAVKDTSKEWNMPIQDRRLAMSRFIIEFGDRLNDHL
ncbi:putative transposase [Yersinia aldovae]|nr:transposase, Mutator family protein [Yersinia aldovae 670-83]CNK18303.1 putative transposase [Yersinia aldovae]